MEVPGISTIEADVAQYILDNTSDRAPFARTIALRCDPKKLKNEVAARFGIFVADCRHEAEQPTREYTLDA